MRHHFWLAFAVGCEVPGDTDGMNEGNPFGFDDGSDEDLDGYDPQTGDCDETDANVNPGAEEICDGIDNNCNDAVDEGVLTEFYTDADVDGFGDADGAYVACEGDGAQNGDDCDDGNPAVNPAAAEVCDGIDNDCDEETDEDVATTYYADADGDGFGDEDAPVVACELTGGLASEAGDCDDNAADVNPLEEERCDERDNDCDESVDEGVTTTYYVDLDGDGWGVEGADEEACVTPPGYADAAGDCDDADAAWHPGADESDCADPNDYNCDGSVAWADADLDTWAACEDCDDNSAGVNPSAAEVCNELDDDCDGDIDEYDVLDATTWYLDYDGDSFGSGRLTEVACEAPADYVANADDCDDTLSSVNPDAIELCNGVDDDCDGATDDGAIDPATWYTDADGDGYGDASTSTESCEQPADGVADATDCDDTLDSVYPGAGETCDGIDEDCNGLVDDGSAGGSTWYADADGDGYGDASDTLDDCAMPTGYVANDGDCDDDDALVVTVCPELGDGGDGSATISGTHDINADATGGRAWPDGVAWLASAVSGTTLTLESTDGLAAGDDVLLVDLEGSGAGAWEVLEVASVSVTTLTLVDAPTGSYPSGDTVIVQRIPQYDDLTVTGALTAGEFDSASGGPRSTGIVALKVRATFTLTGSVDADQLGYAGACASGPYGPSGESTGGGGDGTAGGWAYGGNGGGSGGGADGSASCGDSGGVGGSGGGGGAGKITHCAGGVPCQGGGGGGGGGPYDAVGNESAYDLVTFVLGGGASTGSGGGLSGGSSTGGTGGDSIGASCADDGGGAVLIWARTASIAGGITAHGGAGTDGEAGGTTDGCGSDDGAGGGGAGGEGAAGGSVRLACIECGFGSDTVLAYGGDGGDGGDGGNGYPTTSGGGTGGTGASYGGTAQSGSAGTYSGDGGAPGGGGRGGDAGEGGVIVVLATTVDGAAIGSTAAAATLDDATDGDLSASGAFGP